jgi:hypothetical protein
MPLAGENAHRQFSPRAAPPAVKRRGQIRRFKLSICNPNLPCRIGGSRSNPKDRGGQSQISAKTPIGESRWHQVRESVTKSADQLFPLRSDLTNERYNFYKIRR